MNHEDERVEALLRQFRPRAPRALPAMARQARPRYMGWLGVAAAAAVAVMAANLRFMPMADLRPDPVVGPGLTVQDMRGLLDADAATLDRALMEASKHVLPDVDAPDSALGRLAQP